MSVLYETFRKYVQGKGIEIITIAKVLDKETSLGEKIRTLFREQGITIASILTAIGMAIGVLVEALLPGGGGGGGGGAWWRASF